MSLSTYVDADRASSPRGIAAVFSSTGSSDSARKLAKLLRVPHFSKVERLLQNVERGRWVIGFGYARKQARHLEVIPRQKRPAMVNIPEVRTSCFTVHTAIPALERQGLQDILPRYVVVRGSELAPSFRADGLESANPLFNDITHSHRPYEQVIEQLRFPVLVIPSNGPEDSNVFDFLSYQEARILHHPEDLILWHKADGKSLFCESLRGLTLRVHVCLGEVLGLQLIVPSSSTTEGNVGHALAKERKRLVNHMISALLGHVNDMDYQGKISTGPLKEALLSSVGAYEVESGIPLRIAQLLRSTGMRHPLPEIRSLVGNDTITVALREDLLERTDLGPRDVGGTGSAPEYFRSHNLILVLGGLALAEEPSCSALLLLRLEKLIRRYEKYTHVLSYAQQAAHALGVDVGAFDFVCSTREERIVLDRILFGPKLNDVLARIYAKALADKLDHGV